MTEQTELDDTQLREVMHKVQPFITGLNDPVEVDGMPSTPAGIFRTDCAAMKQKFAEDGFIDPRYILHLDDDQVVELDASFENEHEKNCLLMLATIVITAYAPKAVSFIAEAWMTPPGEEQPVDEKDRKEALGITTFYHVDDDVERIQRFYGITRNKKGKPRLVTMAKLSTAETKRLSQGLPGWIELRIARALRGPWDAEHRRAACATLKHFIAIEQRKDMLDAAIKAGTATRN